MRRLTSSIVLFASVLVACTVDTTGLSTDSKRSPRGNPNAAIVVTEYGDLQCPACKSSHELINGPLLAAYGQQIRFEFKHFPLTQIHPYALGAAQAAECAADQGKFWEFVDIVYEQQEKLSTAVLTEWAGTVGLDTALFDRCVKSGINKATVMADYDAGVAAQVNSTPTYYVNGKKVQNSLDELRTAIEAAKGELGNVPL